MGQREGGEGEGASRPRPLMQAGMGHLKFQAGGCSVGCPPPMVLTLTLPWLPQ